MSAADVRQMVRGIARRRTTLLLAAAAGVSVACNEDFVTGPRDNAVTLDLGGWADTLVLGDARTVRVRVLDARGREIVGVATQLDVAAPAVLETRLNAAAASTARLAVTSTTDSVALAPAHPGAAAVVLTLLDPRFTTTAVRKTATVVVAGVRVASAHDTTLTALGDTTILAASALARQGSGGAADYFPVPGQGVTWTRRGPGAVRLVGTGDSVRVVAEAAGADTLIASHAACLAGARCADTTVVRVAQGGALDFDTRTFRAWSLGDSVVPRVVLADARGHAIVGARVALVPLTAADSALVAVNPAAGTPAFARIAAAARPVAPTTAAGTAPRTSRAAASTPVVRLVAAVPSTSLASATLATPVTTVPLVARANGTAHVAVRALAADGMLLASDTIAVVVRQIAHVVQVAPADADLTPGDSIPVAVMAVDARGHLIADADFQPAMSGAVFRGGRIVVPPTATAGQRATLAMSVVGVAQPQAYATAPFTDPVADSARVRVRVPAPASAGDTSSIAGSDLTTTLLDATGRPRAGVWVRFHVPAGAVVGADSVLTDGSGVARARWSLPTRAGSYTATAVVLADAVTGVRADTAGQIVLRRTATVVPGPAAVLVLRTTLLTTTVLGVPLAPAPSFQVEDAFGNPVAQAGLTLSASVAGGAPGLSLTGTLTAVTDAEGRASFPALVGAGATGTYTLQFTGTTGGSTPSALTPAETAPITYVAGALHAGQTTLVLSAPTVASGAAVTVTVTPKDADGNRVGAGHAVVVSLPTAPGAGVSSATASAVTDRGDGTYTATVTGVLAGTPLPITATVDGAAIPTPGALTVTAGAPATITATAGDAQSAAAGAALPVAPRVRVLDAAGNRVPGATVTFAVATGGGNVAGGATTTNALGEAGPTGWTLGGMVGTQTLTATADGGLEATFTATASAVPTAVAVTPATTTIATIGSTKRIAARVRDASGTTLIGLPVAWSTTTPAAVRIDSTGGNSDGSQWADVTALASGAATVRATRGALQGASAVTVRLVANEITIAPPSAPLKIGETTPLAVAARDSSGNTVPRGALTYTSSDPSVATVDSLGNVRGIGPGTTTVTVTSDGVSTTQTVTIPVSSEFAYADFCTLSGLNLSGTTTRVTTQDGCVMRLTSATGSQAGGVWQPVAQKLDNGFESVVKFRISNPGGMAPGGADGLVFVIQGAGNNVTGEIGLGIGYQGLTKALAVELDTWRNTEASINDPNANHVAVQSCGAGTVSANHSGSCAVALQSTMPFNLKDGQLHTMRITYAPGTLNIYFDGASTPTLSAAVTLTNVNGRGSVLDASGKAWIGFTSGTGGAWANHDVVSWSVTPSP